MSQLGFKTQTPPVWQKAESSTFDRGCVAGSAFFLLQTSFQPAAARLFRHTVREHKRDLQGWLAGGFGRAVGFLEWYYVRATEYSAGSFFRGLGLGLWCKTSTEPFLSVDFSHPFDLTHMLRRLQVVVQPQSENRNSPSRSPPSTGGTICTNTDPW